MVHTSYGTGIVTGTRIIERNGENKEYFCIDLSDDRGTLMIPVDRLDDTELRATMQDMAIIREVMEKQPEELSDHHRTRQNAIEDLISTGKPRMLAQVLRDLSWRRHNDIKLTQTDKKLETRAQKRLLNELALGMQLTVQTVQKRMNSLIEEAMMVHDGEVAVTA